MTVRDILATLDPETEITLAKQNQCGLYPIIKGSSRFKLIDIPISIYKQLAGSIVRQIALKKIDGQPTVTIILL